MFTKILKKLLEKQQRGNGHCDGTGTGHCS